MNGLPTANLLRAAPFREQFFICLVLGYYSHNDKWSKHISASNHSLAPVCALQRRRRTWNLIAWNFKSNEVQNRGSIIRDIILAKEISATVYEGNLSFALDSFVLYDNVSIPERRHHKCVTYNSGFLSIYWTVSIKKGLTQRR